MVSAYFIVMGGFAYDVTDLSDKVRYMALTPSGFLEFPKKHYISPDILDDDNISDRSKADSLGKMLVCIQALWMVINVVAWKASGLPSTLVELNVVVHVVVALVVYALWWNTPLALAHPISLRWKPITNSEGQLVVVGGSEPCGAELLATLLLTKNKLGFYDLKSTNTPRKIKKLH